VNAVTYFESYQRQKTTITTEKLQVKVPMKVPASRKGVSR